MTGLFYLIIISCFIVLAVLALGLLGFMRGGNFNRKYANKIMRWRIGLQAVAVALIILYALIHISVNS